VADLLVVVDDVAEVVAPAVVCFPHAHAIVREVDVAVVAEELRHFGGGDTFLRVVWDGIGFRKDANSRSCESRVLARN
jgi:hypothetical protein